MTTTQAINIKKGISYLTDISGKKIAVQIDLKNSETRDLFEDLLDTLTVIERQDEVGRPFEEFANEYLLSTMA